MKLLMVLLLISMSACATRPPKCSGPLVPINVAAIAAGGESATDRIES